MPKFNPEGLLKAVERYKIEFLALLPSVWSFLSKSPLVDKYDLSSVKAFFSGAASLSKEVEEGLAKRFPMVVFSVETVGKNIILIDSIFIPLSDHSCSRLRNDRSHR